MDQDLPVPGDALACFSVPHPDGEAVQLPVRTRRASIGQAADNDIVLDDDTVSSRHAQLDFEAGSWVLTDLDSRNGTFVDGVKLAAGIPTPVSNAVKLAFGALEVDFLPVDGADPESAQVARMREPEQIPISERQAFRLPVWLLVVIVLMIVLLVVLIVMFGSAPAAAPSVETTTALVQRALPLLL